MYGRIIKLKLESSDDQHSLDVDGLDMKFNIRKNCYFIADASISVLNPGKDIIKRFLTNVKFFQNSIEYRKVSLSVGWKDENKGEATPIFSGQVMSSIPTIPPNVWLNMQCTSRLYADNTENHFSLGDIEANKFNIKDIIERCVATFNKHASANNKYSITYDKSFVDKKMNSFSARGTPRQILMNIASRHKNIVFLYQSDTKILVLDRTKYVPPLHTITPEDGIIGMPKVNWPHVYVEVMMHPNLDVYHDVNLSIPPLDGDDTGQIISGSYRILDIIYKGQLRGGGFSQVLHMIPVEEATKDLEAEANGGGE